MAVEIGVTADKEGMLAPYRSEKDMARYCFLLCFSVLAWGDLLTWQCVDLSSEKNLRSMGTYIVWSMTASM